MLSLHNFWRRNQQFNTTTTTYNNKQQHTHTHHTSYTNSRNEDAGAELQATQKTHASEVEEILQDAADKINAFKAKLAAAKQNGATAKALSVLKKQHRSEKEEAMSDFKDYKRTVRDREDKLQKEFGLKVDGLRTTLETTKDKFKQRGKKKSKIVSDLSESVVCLEYKLPP